MKASARFILPVLALSSPMTASADPALSRPGGGGDAEEFAAGYLALFTCSAHFIMGRELDDILGLELVDLRHLNLPRPQIDPVRGLVTATDHHGRSAMAVHRDSSGCTVLPPHWSRSESVRLPYAQLAPPPDVSRVPFPDGDQATVRMNRTQQGLLESAFDGKTFGTDTATVATVVVRDGKLVGEMYREGFDAHTGYRTWSTAKSISATLVGIGVREGLLRVEDPAPIPEWQYFDDPRQKITLAHLLHMSSGLQSEGAATGALYFGGQDVVSASTTQRLEAEPGTRWKYANTDTLLLLYALRSVLNDDLRYLRFPYDELFHRIGMYHTRLETDHLGHFIGSSQMYTTARDLARFGVLYLNDGAWNGQQILPPGWTDYVASPAPALPRKPGERGYGAQFWLLDSLPGVPEGTYTTAGNKGQYATVVPARNMVIVRTGVDPNGKVWLHDQFISAVIEAF